MLYVVQKLGTEFPDDVSYDCIEIILGGSPSESCMISDEAKEAKEANWKLDRKNII